MPDYFVLSISHRCSLKPLFICFFFFFFFCPWTGTKHVLHISVLLFLSSPPIEFLHESMTCSLFSLCLRECFQLFSIICSGCISQRYWFGVWKGNGKSIWKEEWNGTVWDGRFRTFAIFASLAFSL